MGKLIIFILSALILFTPVFSGTGNNEKFVGAEAFLSGNGANIRISFEHYKMQDGWTPVVLSIGEFNCQLWMDASGRVSELREPGTDTFEPVCFIDMSTKNLQKGDKTLLFDVYEQNNIRTRWKLSSAKTVGTVTKKILFREKRAIELCLGTLRLLLTHIAWDIKEFSPGSCHVRFYGPVIEGLQQFVYEKAAGMIYSQHEWNNRLILEQDHIRATKFPVPVNLTAAGIPPLERAALIAFYNSTDGDNWTNNNGWKTPPLAGDGFALPGTENTWYGITCDPGNTTVQSISLESNNLNGFLPPELGNLVNVQYIFLAWNSLSGSMPPELGNLANLQSLLLWSNQISGSIPPEFGNLANLRNFDLMWNQVSGTIPRELGNLVNLQILHVGYNSLTGNIPIELGNLANLQSLWLHVNQLTGTIPPELGNLVNLQELDLDRNQLIGTIPPALTKISNLVVLSLTTNQLNGTIPPAIGTLSKLEYLHLYGNQLNGSLPPELGDISSLKSLGLGLNQFSGTIPPELGNLANLEILHLHVNHFSGNISPGLTNLSNLVGLNLGDNQFSGPIPPTLGNLSNLIWLSLYSNHFSGSIPPELGNLDKLVLFDLFDNQLNGTIPPELGNLVNLYYLRLNSNKLSGNIPSSLINLEKLSDVDLKWNALYSNDIILRDFLNSKQYGGDWESTQTVAPPDVTAIDISTSSIKITWTPINYTWDSGGYRVFYSNIPGGPYTYYGMTANKLTSSFTFSGLDSGVTYYFVVQTRTNPHGNNQNTVDSEYSAEVSAVPSPIILTSPNGGESWGLHTIRNITWYSAGLAGNVRLEVWKADKKLGTIAANIPINNVTYAWSVGNYGQGIGLPGNDYKVKIITANGLYNDSSNASFSLLQPSLILTSPRSNEGWKLGSLMNITWESLGLTGNVKLLLFRNGVQIGVIARGIPVTNGTYAWTVGKSSSGLAPTGSNYSVKIRCEDNPSYSSGSGSFNIL